MEKTLICKHCGDVLLGRVSHNPPVYLCDMCGRFYRIKKNPNLIILNPHFCDQSGRSFKDFDEVWHWVVENSEKLKLYSNDDALDYIAEHFDVTADYSPKMRKKKSNPPTNPIYPGTFECPDHGEFETDEEHPFFAGDIADSWAECPKCGAESPGIIVNPEY